MSEPGPWVRVLLPESEPCYRSLESGSGEPGPGPEERVEMSPGSHLTWRHHSPSRSWVASVKTEWDWRSVFHQYIMIRLHWAIKNETILCSSSFFLTKCILGYKCCSFFRLQSWGERLRAIICFMRSSGTDVFHIILFEFLPGIFF